MLRAKGGPGVERVVAPPPVIFGGAVLVGLVLQRMLPVPAPAASLHWWVGGILAAAGLALAGAASRRFRAAGNHFEHGGPTSELITTGVFRWTRNPIYCGMTLLCAAVAVLAGAAWILAAVAAALVIVHRGVVLREEAALARQFGDEYARYAARVRRWI